MDVIESTGRPRRGRAVALLGAGLVGGIVLAGYATANAQSPSPSPGAETESAPDTRGPGGKHGGRGHGGMGIHGEFVQPDPDGEGYQTIATQKGEVTAVSATSITVKSEDGYSRTYAVGDDTLVNAGNDGIADVAAGDDVRVVAIVTGETASAVRVDDKTNVERLDGRWRGGPPAPGDGTTAPSATQSSST